MKFTTTVIALAGALTTATATAESKSQLRLHMARRQLEAAADAENNGDGAEEAVELSGSSTLSFFRCYEMTVEADVDGETAEAIMAQNALPVVSYATFYTDQYYNPNGIMSMRLGDFVTTMIQNAVTYDDEFCEQCQAQETIEYCENQANELEEAQEEAAEDEAAEGEEEAEGYPDCYTCVAKGCFAEDKYKNDFDEAELAEFVEEVAQCKQVDYDGEAYYLGFACGSSGDVAEYAVFLDDDCIIQTKRMSASFLLSIAEQDEYEQNAASMYMNSVNYLLAAFTTPMSCNDGDDENDNQEMSEACKQMTENAFYVAECAAEEGQEAENQAQNANQWYEVQLEDADNEEEVCAAIYKQFNTDEEDITYFYDEEVQGSVFDLSGFKNLDSNMISAGMAALIALVVFAIVFVSVLAALTRNKSKSKKSENTVLAEEPLYQLS